MALHNITEAAKLVGKSRQTVYKKIKKGVISLTRGEDGINYIETSELLRVFGSLSKELTGVTPLVNSQSLHQLTTNEVSTFYTAICQLSEQIKASETARKEEQKKYMEAIAELRAEIQSLKEPLLAHHDKPTPTTEKKWSMATPIEEKIQRLGVNTCKPSPT